MATKVDEKEAQQILGEEAWDAIINAATGGQINAEQMRDVVWDLPTDAKKNRLGGNHGRRMLEKGTSADDTEMKNILADWSYYGDMPKNKPEALGCLIKAFDDNGNKPLARELRKIQEALTEQVKWFHLENSKMLNLF